MKYGSVPCHWEPVISISQPHTPTPQQGSFAVNTFSFAKPLKEKTSLQINLKNHDVLLEEETEPMGIRAMPLSQEFFGQL